MEEMGMKVTIGRRMLLDIGNFDEMKIFDNDAVRRIWSLR